MIRRLVVIITVYLAGMSLPAQTSDTALWVPNGPVKSLLLRDSLLYVGGDFSMVSPVLGHFIALDSAGAQDTHGAPMVPGIVNAIARDSIGRIYVGGNFNTVDGRFCLNLFRLDTLGRLDTNFLPSPDGEVLCLEVANNQLWIGGNFHNFAGFSRGSGASLQVTYTVSVWDSLAQDSVHHVLPMPTDQLMPFDPVANGAIFCLRPVIGGTVIYAGGTFSGIGNCPATYLAKLSQATGNYINVGNTFWQCLPNLNGPVRTIQTQYNRLYVGGDFTSIGLIVRKGLAVIKCDNGVFLDHDSNNQPSYNANLNGIVRDMKLVDGKLYIAGQFSVADAQIRKNLACVDTMLDVQAWVADCNSDVYSITLWNDSVFCIGGKFTTVNGDTALHAALFDKTTCTLHPWNPMFNGTVLAVLPGIRNNQVYAGGEFFGAGGVLRNNLCRINTNSGRPDAWKPDINSTVTTLYADAAQLFIAGDFTSADGNARAGIASYSLASATLTAFNPGVDGYVRTMAGDGQQLYIGGNFTTAGGQNRDNLACINIASSQATNWNPGCAGTLNKLILDGDHLYMGGFFSWAGGQARDNLARVSVTTGMADINWSCNTDDGVYDMELIGGRLFFGGWFQHADGQPRLHLAGADTISGAVDPWNPGADSYVRKMAVYNDDLFLSGDFYSAGSNIVSPRLCNYDIGDGQFDAGWTPWPTSMPETMVASQYWLYAGGSFTNIGYRFHPNLSRMDVRFVTGMPSSSPAALAALYCWPNPAAEDLQLSLPAVLPGTTLVVRLVDANGKTVRDEMVIAPTDGSMVRLSVSGLAPGMYSVLLLQDGIPSAVSRFVKISR